MSTHNQRNPQLDEPTWSTLQFPRSGFGQDANGNPFIKDVAGNIWRWIAGVATLAAITLTGTLTAAAGVFTGAVTAASLVLTGLLRAAEWQLNTAAGGVNSVRKFTKTVTAIPDNTATDILTVTIPNTEQGAVVKLTYLSSLGAGGAIGAGEARRVGEYLAVITRTAGVACVVALAAVAEAQTAAVAGATTDATTITATAMTGGVGAQQTFTFQTTITKGGGSSANHTITVIVEILNLNGAGITIA